MPKSTKDNQDTNAVKSTESKAANPIPQGTTEPLPTARQRITSRSQTVVLVQNDQIGISLLKHWRFKQTQLRFELKIPKAVAQRLRRSGWVWRPVEGVYTRQFGIKPEEDAIRESRQLYDDLCLELSPNQLTDASC